MVFDFEAVKNRLASKFCEDSESGCHNWIGSLDANGYPRISIGLKRPCAHRVSYMVNNGRIPEGMVVMHSCDNPRCINPSHLFVGTQAENIQDSVSKGRMGKSRLKDATPDRSMKHGRVMIASNESQMLVFHRWHSATCMGFRKGPMMRAARGRRNGLYKGYFWQYG